MPSLLEGSQQGLYRRGCTLQAPGFKAKDNRFESSVQLNA